MNISKVFLSEDERNFLKSLTISHLREIEDTEPVVDKELFEFIDRLVFKLTE